MTTNGHSNGAAMPKITFYTNHSCPYAHRAQITLDHLKLPYEEVIIDLATPREQWYLDINPRGLVPSIKYTSADGAIQDAIVTESAVVAQFLAEAHPELGSLLPDLTTGGAKAALDRARINFFVDTWNSKVTAPLFGILMEESREQREAKAEAWFQTVEKEIEPLLHDAAPFFNGSASLTFVEVIAAPAVLRWFALGEDGELVPKSFVERLNGLRSFGRWAEAVRRNETVTKVWDAEGVVESMKGFIKKRKAAAAKH